MTTRQTVLAVTLALAACAKGPKQDTFPGRQLGESTKSPGANASKPQPITPDDPQVMNVSASITPQQQQQAQPAQPTTAAQPTQPTTQPTPAPQRDATSSTPVTQPRDI